MKLHDWMEEQGLNDSQFAAKFPVVSRSQISRIRRGKSTPPPETARKLAEITKIPAARFAMGEAGQ